MINMKYFHMRISTFGHHLLRNLLYSWWHESYCYLKLVITCPKCSIMKQGTSAPIKRSLIFEIKGQELYEWKKHQSRKSSNIIIIERACRKGLKRIYWSFEPTTGMWIFEGYKASTYTLAILLGKCSQLLGKLFLE